MKYVHFKLQKDDIFIMSNQIICINRIGNMC